MAVTDRNAPVRDAPATAVTVIRSPADTFPGRTEMSNGRSAAAFVHGIPVESADRAVAPLEMPASRDDPSGAARETPATAVMYGEAGAAPPAVFDKHPPSRPGPCWAGR